MNITEKTLGIWFVELTSPATGDVVGDFLVSATETDSESSSMEGRFRWYDPQDPGNDPFSGKDQKKFFRAEGGPPPAQAVEEVRAIVQRMAMVSGREMHELLRGDDGPDGLMQRLMAQPWAHFRTVPKADAWKYETPGGTA